MQREIGSHSPPDFDQKDGGATQPRVQHPLTIAKGKVPNLTSARSSISVRATVVDVSVVIATFRRPQQLSEALTSVLKQTGVSLEAIVVDDSPESSARDVVENFKDSRVRYITNPEPSGGFPSVVRNLGRGASLFIF